MKKITLASKKCIMNTYHELPEVYWEESCAMDQTFIQSKKKKLLCHYFIHVACDLDVCFEKEEF